MKFELSKLRIRPVKEEELLRIFEIERQSFKDPYPIDLLRYLLRSNPLSFLVAEFAGKIVGYVIGTVRFPNMGHVLNIAVDPQFRRRGVGTALMKKLMEYFRGRGVSLVRLEARESNRSAHKFYLSLGFEMIGKVPLYYSDGETAFLFEKEL